MVQSGRLGDGHTVEANGSGQVKISVEITHGRQMKTRMGGILYAPKLACNLFSIRAVTQKGLIVQFGHSYCWIKNSTGKVVGKGKLVNRMYLLNCKTEMLAFVAEANEADEGNIQMKLSGTSYWDI